MQQKVDWRHYSIGGILIVLVFALLWRNSQQPTPLPLVEPGVGVDHSTLTGEAKANWDRAKAEEIENAKRLAPLVESMKR